jgi:hypothetical protein
MYYAKYKQSGYGFPPHHFIMHGDIRIYVHISGQEWKYPGTGQISEGSAKISEP